ncbi:MAG: hypothetical protein GYA48_10250 [Chloroflexi bacterium]|nr:hypothetical protein [Chloroflexota bacterium]
MEQAEILQIQETYKESLLSFPQVVGVGTGYKVTRGQITDRLCIVALVKTKLPKSNLLPQQIIPREIDGAATDVFEVGEIRAFQNRTDVWRPAPGGVSIGHFRITAGTLGCVVRDRETGTRLILSNNHVLANSNLAELGDPILQPGPADGGTVKDHTIAELARFVPIQFNESDSTCSFANAVTDILNGLAGLFGSHHRLTARKYDTEARNLVDAALARPLNDADVLDNILEIGEIEGTLAPELGMPVRKSGRTTGFTTGQITVVNATVSVNYMENRIARFEEQIVTTPFSQGGDSGSLVVNGDQPKAVGLLFAGSNQTTIFNPIQHVLDLLEIDL